MKMQNNDSTFDALDRIRDAGVKFVGAIKAKRMAIADLYAVYLDALDDEQIAITIQRAFSALSKPPKTDELAAQIGYLAVSSERRRVSEVKKALVEARAAKIDASGMYAWLIKRARINHGKRQGHTPASLKPPVHAFATKLFVEAKNRTTLAKAPIPVACEPGEFLIQICERQPNGKFIASWIKATKSDFEFLASAATVLPSPANSQSSSTSATRADLVQQAQQAA